MPTLPDLCGTCARCKSSILITASIFLLSACSSYTIPDYQAENGFLDLSAHNFSVHPEVFLSGEWLLFPGKILGAEEVELALNPLTPSGGEISPGDTKSHRAFPVRVPGGWQNQDFSGNELDYFGTGTCVLDIALPENAPELVFYKELIHDSNETLLNGERFGGPLILDQRNEDLVRPNGPEYYCVPVGSNRLRIIIQAANYWDQYGIGIHVTPRLGETAHMQMKRFLSIGYESVLIGLMFMTALYHFMLFLIQRRDRALLFFSVIATAVLFRQMATSEKFWLTLAGLSNTPMLRIEHGSVQLICALFSLYFMSLFPKESIKPLCFSLSAFSLALLAMDIFMPIQFFSDRVDLLHFNVIINSINGFYILGLALARKRQQSFVMLFALIALVVPSLLDILNTSNVIEGRFLMPIGLVPFILAQSYALATRYTRDTKDAEKLRVTAQRLTKLDEIKTNFLANVSHELRTPISLIKAPIESIREGEYGASIPNDHPVFTLIQGNVQRLLQLIENLLNLTRLESTHSFVLVPADLCELIPVYRDEFAALTEKKGITLALEFGTLSPDKTLVAEIDVKAFESIFFNLMSNAIKFTPTEGTITIRLSLTPGTGKSMAMIEVRDTGIGIADEDQKTIFARYRRIYDTGRHHYEGSGLGLSIAHGTARALGGDLTLTSAAGKGSSFFITLPLSTATPVEIEKQQTQFQDQPNSQVLSLHTVEQGTIRTERKDRILIVEDHDDLRAYIASSLESDYQILQAGDGMAAQEILQDGWAPDLILSDIMMPRLDGIGLYEFVRNDPILISIPFIFLTARDESEERLKLLTEGAVHYLVKPFSIRELRAIITSTLTLRNAERTVLIDRLKHALSDIDSRNSGIRPEAAHVSSSRYPADISARESDVLDLVIEGLSDKEIAERLSLSTRTASNHVAAILKKTGLSSRQSLRQRFEKLLSGN